MYVGKDIIPKIAVDKAARGVFVANNIFYFENDPIMVLGDQYKPDVGGGSQIKNVFFENNIFKKNHWPKETINGTIMYIDSKFNVNGIGLVVSGTVRGKSIKLMAKTGQVIT